MKIIVVGSSSFAAQGLTDLLRRQGHEVWSLNRRPERALGARGLAGSISVIAGFAEQLQGCDVLINYLLLKDSSLEQNFDYLEKLRRMLRLINCRRFVHISSVSVLPPVNGTVTEKDEPHGCFRQKGGYARLKIATESWVTENVIDCEVVVVRPGFVLAPGLLDPIVGMGKLLHNHAILGLGHRKSIIPIISRLILNEGVARLCVIPLAAQRITAMLTDPVSPTREDYLDYCCNRFGMGRAAMFLPPWLWRVSLAAASLPISLMKRQWINLPARFSHNLKLRRYDSLATARLLNLDLHHEWKTLLRETLEFQQPNFRLPAPFDVTPASSQTVPGPGVCYLGMGRIARERHLPALSSIGPTGLCQWYDPFLESGPAEASLRRSRAATPQEFLGSKVVCTTPVGPRMELLSQLPPTVNEVLFEKPFAITSAQYSQLHIGLSQRPAYVIHNYRFKPNVQWALRYLASHNPGRLIETRLHFDSPAVDLDKASWLREERAARTLLLDYAIHFLDLAWLLAEGEARIKHLDLQRNVKGQTMSVSATVAFDNHVSHLMMRQGARQRRCQIEFVFSNYTLLLRFFPEAAAVIHGQYTFADDFRLGFRGLASVARKVAEKLGLIGAEPSHQLVLGAFLGYYKRENIAALSVEALKPFYSRLFVLAEQVYSEPTASGGVRVPARPPLEKIVRNEGVLNYVE